MSSSWPPAYCNLADITRVWPIRKCYGRANGTAVSGAAMRVFLLLAALSATAPTPAEEHAGHVGLCNSANTHPVKRIEACRLALNSGRLTRTELADAYYASGRARRDLGQKTQAVRDFSDAIRRNPKHANALYERGQLFESMALFRESLQDYDHAIALDPDFALALNSAAWLLAAAPDAALRDGVRAIRMAKRALRLVAYPAHRDTLAAAYAAAGRFDDAIGMQETAIAALRTTGRVLLLPAYKRRLELYRAGKPYRGQQSK